MNNECTQANGLDLKGNFHDNVVRILKELPARVCLVCARKITGSSPMRGTIVDNVDTGKSEKAFASRVSVPHLLISDGLAVRH